MNNFELVPFSASEGIEIRGAIRRSGAGLSVWYLLRDAQDNVALTDFSPTRQNNLWQHTCFELFFGEQGSPHYWEMNVTPSSAWNVYAFSAPRSGMCEETKIRNIEPVVYTSSDSIVLHYFFDINRLLPKHSVVEIGISCVVALRNGEKSYWALAHNKEIPDFHDRSAFLLHI